MWGERMISILGNREITKFRLRRELNCDFIETLLRQEKNKASLRSQGPAWIDNKAVSFLSYLKVRFNTQESEQVTQQFLQQSAEDKIINYAKWMLANSCGAPDLWNDIASEAKSVGNDKANLEKFLHFFCEKEGDYVRYLNHTQIGAQIGPILFTHGGIHDHSFSLPKTLTQLLHPKELKRILDDRQDGKPLLARDIGQLLEALNAWYAEINRLRFSASKEVDSAISELITMGLPIQRNQGASVINLPAHRSDGSYGIPLKASTLKKLSAAEKPVYIICHGHKPAEFPQCATTISAKTILQRIDGDTSYFRRNKACLALAFYQEKDSIFIKAECIDEAGKCHTLSFT